MHGGNAKPDRQARIAAKQNLETTAPAKRRLNATIIGVIRKTTAMANPEERTDGSAKKNYKTVSRRKTNPGAHNCWLLARQTDTLDGLFVVFVG